MNLILASIGVFLGIILLLVVILLVAKQYLTPSGKVKITINGEKELEVEQGSTLLNTLRPWRAAFLSREAVADAQEMQHFCSADKSKLPRDIPGHREEAHPKSDRLNLCGSQSQ